MHKHISVEHWETILHFAILLQTRSNISINAQRLMLKIIYSAMYPSPPNKNSYHSVQAIL